MSGPEPGSDATQSISIERAEALLLDGEIELQGRVPWSSNFTFLATVGDDTLPVLAVYKPLRGERPLWDFDSGTLCRREVAAYALSRALGWPNIPPTVLRDGPHGPGSLQLYIASDLDEHYLSLMQHAGPAMDAAFRRIVLFDYVANNADRKAGHVLRGPGDTIWAIDHGLTFHCEYKLRTVIWDYAQQRIEPELLGDLRDVESVLSDERSLLRIALSALIATEEIEATISRAQVLLAHGRYPGPADDRRNVPYPLV